MSKDADRHANQEQTNDQPPSTDSVTANDHTPTESAGPATKGNTTPSVFYTTDAGGGENHRWAGSSGATICANLAEGDLEGVPTPSDPGETLILAPSGRVAEETATQLEELGYDVYRRGNLSNQPAIIDGTLAYLAVLAAPSPSDRDGDVRTLVEDFYGLPPDELVQRVEVEGHDPTEIDDTWALLTTVATFESNTPGDIPERAALAVEDIETLRDEVGHRSIQVAFARLSDRLNLREYATERETAGLANLTHAVTSGTWVDTETVVENAPPLSVNTVNELGRKVNEDRDNGLDEAPPGHFEVGTIHSAKGHEKKTVVLVGLSDYWPMALSNTDAPENFDRTVTEFTADVVSSTNISFKHRQQDNARLLMYVAVSRAEERLILLGGKPVDPNVSPPEDHGLPDSLVAVKEMLPDVTGSAVHYPWSELLASLPDSSVDLGDVDGTTERSRFSLSDNPISEAGAAVYLDNQKETASDRFTVPAAPDGLVPSRRPRPLTYSALKTVADDPATYYRRHVLGEPDLDLPATVPDDECLQERLDVDASGDRSGVRRRVVGDLVHFTAETLYGADADVDEWKELCAAIADTIEASTAEREAAAEHIDRLFATDAMTYTVCGTEIRVAPQIVDEPVYGRVDAVVEHPERPGELLALDFKTGQRAHADPLQLWFYLLGLAESDQFDRPVTAGAFVYLDETPEIGDHVTVDDADELDTGRAKLEQWVTAATNVTHEVLDEGSD